MDDEHSIAVPPPLPEIVQQYLNGKTIAELAKEHKRCRATLYNWIHSEAADRQYPDLVKAAIVTRYADCEDSVESASTMLDYVRARELLASAKFQLERRLKMFAMKQESTTDTTIRVLIAPVPSRDKPLDLPCKPLIESQE